MEHAAVSRSFTIVLATSALSGLPHGSSHRSRETVLTSKYTVDAPISRSHGIIAELAEKRTYSSNSRILWQNAIREQREISQ